MTTSVDAITHEVLRHRLWSINEEHGLTIARISGSPIVTLSHDFNPSIHLPDGEVVYSGPYIQYLNAGATTAIRWILEKLGSKFVRPGDMFLTNDPWIGVSHQLDVCILAPLCADGEIVGWVSNAVHQYDLGGTLPGSFTPQALSIYEEALPIPPIRIVEEGEIRPDLEQMFLRRSRLPDLLALDLRAGIGGCNVAMDALTATIDEYGVDAIQTTMHRIVDDSEVAFMDRLATIPPGRWLQDYFVEARDGTLLRLVLGLEKSDDGLIFDNCDDPDQDAAQAMTDVGFRGAVLAAVATALCNDQLFAIGGATRRVSFELKPGSLGNADVPAPMSCANMRVAQLTSIASHVVAKMVACSRTESADAVGAGASAGLPVLLISGRDARGNPYGTALSDHMAGGVAPSLHRDGVDSGGHSWDPRSLVPNVEDQELVFPILYLYRNELPDSGGAGMRRGANGGSFAYVPLDVDEITVATVTSGAATRVPPTPGLAGGDPSGTTGYRMLRNAVRTLGQGDRLAKSDAELAPSWEPISARSTGIAQRAGDAVEERWCGTGGLGDPLDRDPFEVVRDITDERISSNRARSRYGVVVAEGELDTASTTEMRDRIRGERLRLSTEPRSSITSATGEVIAAVGHHLLIVATTDGHAWACRCGQLLCSTQHDFRDGARHRVAPLASGEHVAFASAVATDAIDVHEFFCPACARLLSVDVTLEGAAPTRDIELYLT